MSEDLRPFLTAVVLTAAVALPLIFYLMKRAGSRKLGGQVFVVKRKIIGPRGFSIEACEGTYHARDRKSLDNIFREEGKRFAQFCLGCRLEHEVVEEE